MNTLVMAAAAALVAGAAGTAQAETWNMPTPYADSVFHTINVQQFAEDVTEATDGELEIIVHSAGSLFAHPEIHEAVLTQQVPIGEMLISLLANEDAVYGIDSVPFLATSYDASYRLWEASRPYIAERLEADGLRLLFAVPWPPQGLYSANPVDSVEDMAGVPFRAYNAGTARCRPRSRCPRCRRPSPPASSRR